MHLYCPGCSTNIYIENEVRSKRLNCPTCGCEINLEELRRRQGSQAGPETARTAAPRPRIGPQPLAWELAGPWYTRLWLTCYQVLFRPHAAFQAVAKPGIKAPYVFGTIMYYLLAASVVGNYWGETQAEAAFYASLALVIIGPLISLAFLSALAALQHVLLLLFKAGGAPFGATFRVVGYSAACVLPMVLGYALAPLIGPAAGPGLLTDMLWACEILAVLWWMLVQILGLTSAHRTDLAKVLVLVSLEMAILLALYLGLSTA